MTDCQEIEPIGWRLPRVALRGLRPQEHSSLTSTVALRPIRLARIRFSGAPSRLGPGDFAGLDRPRQTERKPGKTASFERIRAQRLQGLGIIYIILNRAACRQRA